MKKSKMTVILSVTVLLCVALGLTVAVFIAKDGTVFEKDFSLTVQVGEDDREPAKQEFMVEVPKTGTYYLYADWKSNQPGIIAGIMLTSSAGEVLFYAAGDEAQMESDRWKLDAGNYTITLYGMGSENQLEYFCEKANSSEESPEFDFTAAKSGTVTGELSLQMASFTANHGIGFGVLVGVMVGVVILILFLTASTVDGGIKRQYDERQELVQGRGFKYGFFTILFCNAVLSMCDIGTEGLPAEASVQLMFSIILGVAVYACYCIWNEGYYALNERPGRLIVFSLIIGICNVLIFFRNLSGGAIIENGSITFRVINLFCAVLAFAVLAVTCLKYIHGKREDAE